MQTLHFEFFKILIIYLGIFVSACSPMTNNPIIPEPEILNEQTEDPPAKVFWSEPFEATIIGKNQLIHIYAVMQMAGDAFPKYIPFSEVTVHVENPLVVEVDSSGQLKGVSAGRSKITLQYSEFQTELSVQVSGVMERKSVVIPGQGSRFYELYTPEVVNAELPLPLLLSFHGGGGTSAIQAETSRLNELASKNGIVVAYPEGTGLVKTFNAGACCNPAKISNIDDVKFSKMMIEQIEANLRINSNKIFASGFSNGAIMAHRLACELSEKISGIAAISGGSGEFDLDKNQYFICNPIRPIPVLQFHAKNDRNYPINGGFGAGSSGTNFYSISATTSDWMARNNLTTEFSEQQVSLTTICKTYSKPIHVNLPFAKVAICESNPIDLFDSISEVVYGGGHSWPGGNRSPSAKGDIPLKDFSASEYLWNFFN